MSDEIFDIVNEHDEVIGQRLRREVHRDGDKHRAVHVLVFNSHGEIFLQKRSMTKDTFPGRWDSSASGHLDTGEHYDACAIRELREEIGLTTKVPLKKLFKLEACQQTGQEFVWIYRCTAEGPFTLHPEEIERGQWFTPDHINNWIRRAPQEFAPSFALIWSKWNGAKYLSTL
jgi:isopentenyl-diphosphate delta-isomerase type 1